MLPPGPGREPVRRLTDPQRARLAARGPALHGLRLRPVNAGIKFFPALRGKALFTVECHGSRCGFCTPGFAMMLWSSYENHGTDVGLWVTKEFRDLGALISVTDGRRAQGHHACERRAAHRRGRVAGGRLARAGRTRAAAHGGLAALRPQDQQALRLQHLVRVRGAGDHAGWRRRGQRAHRLRQHGRGRQARRHRRGGAARPTLERHDAGGHPGCAGKRFHAAGRHAGQRLVPVARGAEPVAAVLAGDAAGGVRPEAATSIWSVV
jgi:hypothetical protein